jgi:hypothetical protein
MAARDKREETGEKAGDHGDRDLSPLDHHLGHREEPIPLGPGDEPETDGPSGKRD